MEIGPLLASRIYFISQFGKYLPGNVAQHLGRLAMCVQERLPGSVVAASQVVELLMITGPLSIIAVTVGPSYLMEWELDLARVWPGHIALAAIALICGALLTVSLCSLDAAKVVRRPSPWPDRLATGNSTFRLGHYPDPWKYWGHHTGTLLHCDSGQWPALTVLGRYWRRVCRFMASRICDPGSSGRPWRAGNRNVLLLSQNMPVPDAVTVSLVFRVATTATDLTVFGFGLCLRPERSGNIASIKAAPTDRVGQRRPSVTS